MLNKRYFVRNADGSIKQKEPCQTPGCRYPNFHLCFGATSPQPEPGEAGPAWFQDLENKFERVQAKMAERIKLRNERNFERDAAIVQGYNSGMTQTALAEKYGISRHQIRGVLDRREELVAA